MLDRRRVLLRMLRDVAYVWFSLTLVLGVGGGTVGSAAVDNICDRRRSFTLGGGDGYTLGGGTLLCIGGYTLRGVAGLWVGGCAGRLVVGSSCTSVSCISFVITPLLIGCVSGGGDNV